MALAPAAVAVGVDLEWMATRDFMGMARAAFSTNECEYLATLDDPSELCSRFYEFWTLKEAFAKALGLALVDALGQCRMVDASGARRVRGPDHPALARHRLCAATATEAHRRASM